MRLEVKDNKLWMCGEIVVCIGYEVWVCVHQSINNYGWKWWMWTVVYWWVWVTWKQIGEWLRRVWIKNKEGIWKPTHDNILKWLGTNKQDKFHDTVVPEILSRVLHKDSQGRDAKNLDLWVGNQSCKKDSHPPQPLQKKFQVLQNTF